MMNIEAAKEVEKLIKNSRMSIIYFTGNTCGVCEVIKEKLENLLKSFPEISFIEISGEKNVELAIKYDIFTLPIMLLFIDSKEFLRVGRNVDLLDLECRIKRYYYMIF